jgi:hypothetical protein
MKSIMRKTADPHWRGNRAIHWIEDFCRVPSGFNKGDRVRLTPEQKDLVRSVYEDGTASVPIGGELGAYVALMHLCGPEAKQKDFAPAVEVDSFSVWAAAASAELQAVLRRHGERIVCPELGTTFPREAA